ncbi:MAG: dephospho-CoA kinase, partial [Cryobacterium sp.]
EAAVNHTFDLIVVTHADEETRVRRMVDLRGMSAADAAQRIGSQARDADRLAVADVVIDTDGTLEHTLTQVDALHERVRGELDPSSVGGSSVE